MKVFSKLYIARSYRLTVTPSQAFGFNKEHVLYSNSSLLQTKGRSSSGWNSWVMIPLATSRCLWRGALPAGSLMGITAGCKGMLSKGSINLWAHRSVVPEQGQVLQMHQGTQLEQVLESLLAGMGGGEQLGPGKERKGTGVEKGKNTRRMIWMIWKGKQLQGHGVNLNISIIYIILY